MLLRGRDPYPPLNYVQVNAATSRASWSMRLQLTDYKMIPNDLTVLARILLGSGHKKTARDLVFASARLGDDEAILLIIKEAVKLDDLSSPRVALIYQQRFRPMLQRKHPAALYLEGQKFEREGQSRRALEIYEEIVAANTTETFAAFGDITGAEIWKALGKLRAKNKDRNGAEAAISTAALQYDDPGALFQLAKTFTSPSAREYELYMLKAAASGEAKAAHELGLLYLKQSQGRISMTGQASSTELMPQTGAITDRLSHERKTKFAVEPVVAMTKRRDAQEWFSIGAESGIIGSQLYLAILLRDLGKLDDGLRWLTLAGKPGDLDSKEFHTWNPVVSHIANKWHDSDLKLADLDVDAPMRMA